MRSGPEESRVWLALNRKYSVYLAHEIHNRTDNRDVAQRLRWGGKSFPRCSSPGQVIGTHSKRRRRGNLHHVAINKTAQTHWKSHNEWIKSLTVVLQSVKCHSPQKYISETLVSSGDERKGRRSFGSRHPQLQLNASQDQPTEPPDTRKPIQITQLTHSICRSSGQKDIISLSPHPFISSVAKPPRPGALSTTLCCSLSFQSRKR